jgi:hypothetical protein
VFSDEARALEPEAETFPAAAEAVHEAVAVEAAAPEAEEAEVNEITPVAEAGPETPDDVEDDNGPISGDVINPIESSDDPEPEN